MKCTKRRLNGSTASLHVWLGLSAFRRPAPNRWPVVPALAAVVMAARAEGLA
jgi:hypothetical protein